MIFQHYRELVKPKDAARYFQIGPAKAAKKIVPMVAARLPEKRFRSCFKGRGGAQRRLAGWLYVWSCHSFRFSQR
jgi:hypothetical protein